MNTRVLTIIGFLNLAFWMSDKGYATCVPSMSRRLRQMDQNFTVAVHPQFSMFTYYEENYISREEVYAYCCSLGMVLPMENVPAERIAIMTAVRQNAPGVNLTDFFFGDTYNEVTNGNIQDFYCKDGSSVLLTYQLGVKNRRTCLVYQADYAAENDIMFTVDSDYCEKRVFGGSFVCEFYP